MILLILVLCCLGINIFIGYKSGFVKVAFSLVGWFIGIMASYLLTPYVADFIVEKTELKYTIESALGEQITNAVGEMSIEAIESLPEGFQKIVLGKHGSIEEMMSSGAESLIDVSGLAESIIYVIALIVVLFVVRCVLVFIERALVSISKLPIIGGVNRILGIAAGAVKGLVWSWVLLAIVTLITIAGYNTQLITQINNSAILTWLYDNNIIVNMLGSLL